MGGGVVQLIGAITAQINLLALNATMNGRGPVKPAAASPWSRPR